MINAYSMIKKLEKFLEELRPALQYDGGDIEIVKVDVNRGAVHIRFTGACSHCAISDITLKQLIERQILQRFPKIKKVIPV